MSDFINTDAPSEQDAVSPSLRHLADALRTNSTVEEIVSSLVSFGMGGSWVENSPPSRAQPPF